MPPYRNQPGKCCACEKHVDDLSFHYAAGPNACPALAQAFPCKGDPLETTYSSVNPAGYERVAQPCSHCGVNPRAHGRYWCASCRNEAERDNQMRKQQARQRIRQRKRP